LGVVCSSCGQEGGDGAAFCDNCGAGLSAGCPQCGSENRPEAKFCRSCGTRLAGAVAQPAADGAVTSLRPEQRLSEAGAEATTAERRLVSVLFADLVAFTSYSEGRDPEDVRETLTRYFEAARDVIDRHGGRVEKFIGDAVMAAWGAPRANEDDPERAVRAGLEVVRAVGELGEGLHARVAVLTGQAAVTLGATDQGMVAGDLVNTAARLQAVAPPDTVLVGRATMQAASSAIAFEEVGEQVLRGKEAPVAAWRALRVISDTRGRGRSEVLEPPFVGRDLELRLLKDVLHATSQERRPRLVSITGPAGIGKSRLAWEFEKYADGLVERIFWHRGRSPSYGDGISFWALGEMVRRRARLSENDDETTTRDHIAEAVVEFVDVADAAWVEQSLLTLLGLEPPPPGGRESLFAAWRTFFERVAARQTTVLLFEDLQWADSGQLDFIDHLLEWARGVPLLVVTLARPDLLERRPGWGTRARSFSAIGLEPLTEAQMRELLLGLVPSLPEGAVARVLERAGGIPLYAVETVRMLINDGRLVAESEGRYRPQGDLGDLAVPDTLRALVGSRLDALDANDRSLIQDATVLGQVFDHHALAHISGLDEADVEERLRALVRRELLETSVDPRSPERGQYGFVQSVIREVAYDTLARRDRRARHLAAARYYESVGDEELAAVLATHYLAALQSSEPGPESDALQVQARLALRGAADRAMSLGSPEQAVTHLEAALGITTQASERAELLARAADAALAAARLQAAEDYARAAVAAFEESGAHDASLAASGSLGSILLDTGRLDEAVAMLEAAATAATAYPEIRADLLARLARAYMRQVRDEEAVAAADQALAIAEPLRIDRIVAEALVNKGSAMFKMRRLREPVLLVREGARIAAEAGDLDLELRARSNIGSFIAGHDLVESVATCQEALEMAKRLGMRKNALWLTSLLCSVSAYRAEGWDETIAVLESTLEEEEEPSTRGTLLGTRIWFSVFQGTETRRIWAEIDRLVDDHPDLEELRSYGFHHGWESIFADRLDDAEVAFRDSIPHLGQELEQAYWGLLATAVLCADLDTAREVHEQFDLVLTVGDSGQAGRALSKAVIAALEGRPDDAIQAFRESIAWFDKAGWTFFTALAKWLALVAVPDDASVQGWAGQARIAFETVGAAPLIRLLDRAEAALSGVPTAGA
jgi:class 3 adenylate cyclase/tetratricopeptide (TPR) repeat protein